MGRPLGSARSPIVPIAGAIGVFGVVYGAAAGPLLGWPLTLASSAVMFSGAAQFSMVGLLGAGASPWAVLWAIGVLNLRHLVLGAAIRPGLAGGRIRRAVAAWFVIDETVGLALARDGGSTVLVRAGTWCYGAWVAGTALGLAGGTVVGLEALAGSVFPVLFIALASIMVRGAGQLVRTAVAAGLTLLLLVAWPGLGGVAPVLAAVTVSIGGTR
ncbi:MAG: AzlC family ABC transporter permease [Acidimicrobiales bacterium]